MIKSVINKHIYYYVCSDYISGEGKIGKCSLYVHTTGKNKIDIGSIIYDFKTKYDKRGAFTNIQYYEISEHYFNKLSKMGKQ